jgi:hypothetical protein
MSQALALPRPHSLAPPRIRINWDPPFFLGLIAPAVLIGFLRMWTFFLAPRYGVYFTSELVLIASGREVRPCPLADAEGGAEVLPLGGDEPRLGELSDPDLPGGA